MKMSYWKLGQIILILICELALSSCQPVAFRSTVEWLATEPTEWVWDQNVKLTADDDLVANAAFGCSVSISENYAIIGANGEKTFQGAAYIFSKNGDTWGPTHNRLPSPSPDDWECFGYSVSIDGDYAAIGTDIDKVYIFKHESDSWVHKKTIVGPASSYFGHSVAIANNSLLVGAPGSGGTPGAAYMYFEGQGGSDGWGAVNMPLPPGISNGDYVGCSVSISNQYAIIGAYGDNSGMGIAYLYEKADNYNWTLIATLTADDGKANDQFGFSVAIADDYAIAGAELKQNAYIFKRDNTNWIQDTKLTPSHTNESFGHSVAISGTYAIVGAYNSNSARGSVYIYENESGVWEEIPSIEANDGNDGDSFGISVSIRGSYGISGAPSDSDTLSNAGSSYILWRHVK